jgi:hypothetical protein
MKKLFAIALVAVAFVACNSAETKKETPNADSTIAAKIDTAAAKIDTAAKKLDSTVKAVVDTAKKAVKK